MNPHNTCDKCKFWTSAFKEGDYMEDDDGSSSEFDYGVCRRFPPVVAVVQIHVRGNKSDYYAQPRTASFDACGEFKSPFPLGG
jgi:hypothetical protein